MATVATGNKPQPERFVFTERRLGQLEHQASGARYIYDATEPALGVRVTPTRAVYVFSVWHNGGHRRLTIAPVGQVQLREAREVVRRHRGDLARGIDVFTQPAEQPMTLQAAFQLHTSRPGMRPSTRRDYMSLWTRMPVRLKARAITDVRRAELAELHRAIGTRHRRTADKMLALISVLCREHGRRGDNPTAGICRHGGEPRQRVLTLDELRRLRGALAHEREPWRGFFLLAMLTGARRGALARVQWQDLDLDGGVWRVPAMWSKNRKVLTVTLVDEAVGILRGLYAARGASPFVFPSNSKVGHLTEPKKAWRRVCDRAGIAGAVIHDLRRTVGTMVASDGGNAAVIGAVLGHLSPQSAKSYLHLSSEVGREYLERAARKSRAA
jgi:integrase